MSIPVVLLFKESIGNNDGTDQSAKESISTEEEIEETDERLVCRQCKQIITSLSERISLENRFEHTFANPSGIVFQIGCFRFVRNCRSIGPASAEFSWFRGYLWRVVVCANCDIHLGWSFSGASGDSFHGLILDRIVSSRNNRIK